ncbi:MAG: hypothetical protein OWT28_10810 [Firmicutes bacterium]|nr:hypothetical protein [Bacillota bacterium]
MHMQAHISLLLEGTCHLTVAGVPEFLVSPSDTPVSLRFAASSALGQPQLVIGLRKEGSGIDLLLPASDCAGLLPEPDVLVIHCADASAEPLTVPFDHERFLQFIELVDEMQRALPEHPVWGALAAAFD